MVAIFGDRLIRQLEVTKTGRGLKGDDFGERTQYPLLGVPKIVDGDLLKVAIEIETREDEAGLIDIPGHRHQDLRRLQAGYVVIALPDVDIPTARACLRDNGSDAGKFGAGESQFCPVGKGQSFQQYVVVGTHTGHDKTSAGHVVQRRDDHTRRLVQREVGYKRFLTAFNQEVFVEWLARLSVVPCIRINRRARQECLEIAGNVPVVPIRIVQRNLEVFGQRGEVTRREGEHRVVQLVRRVVSPARVILQVFGEFGNPYGFDADQVVQAFQYKRLALFKTTCPPAVIVGGAPRTRTFDCAAVGRLADNPIHAVLQVCACFVGADIDDQIAVEIFRQREAMGDRIAVE